ncbi:hypothetical protein D8674_036694 [Pyrus ussuriensis x Pyrus communis]|uniref:DUF4408 domain-containing protein n=1 Tax=Pyrus ussuriensis x Pyrus communis TaxID=2448454 RepID=A0A5N5FSA1_9ROSA|nr:hypothetical protein D8674_036694 [Pyrus ussuriensis x Pyrus communis]
MADPSSSLAMWAWMLSWFTPSSLFLLLNLMIGIIVLSSHYETHKKPEHQQLQQQEEQPGLFSSPRLERTPSLLDRVRSINLSHYKFEQPNPETHYTPPQHADLDNSTGSNRTPSPQLERTPSLLDRFRSINFSHYKFEQSTSPEVQSGESAAQLPGSSQTDSNSPVGLARTPSLLERLKSMDFPFYRPEHADPENKIHEPEESEHEARDPSFSEENLVHRNKSNSGNGARVNQREKIKKSTSDNSLLRGGVEGNNKETDIRPAMPRVKKTKSFGGHEAVDAKANDFINKFKQQLRLQRLESIKKSSQ